MNHGDAVIGRKSTQNVINNVAGTGRPTDSNVDAWVLPGLKDGRNRTQAVVPGFPPSLFHPDFSRIKIHVVYNNADSRWIETVFANQPGKYIPTPIHVGQRFCKNKSRTEGRVKGIDRPE